MRDFIKRLLLVMVLLAPGGISLSAQFTIQNQQEASRTDLGGMVEVTGIQLKTDYFDVAAHMAEKRRIRKERNTVEFRGNLQTSLQQYENWAGSEKNNFNGVLTAFFQHSYKREKFSLLYNVDLDYRMNVIAGVYTKTKDVLKSKVNMGWFMHANWRYSAEINMETQLTGSYNKSEDSKTLTRSFMAPGNVKPSVGFTYQKPGSSFIMSVSPLTGSITTMLNRQLVREHWEKERDKEANKDKPEKDWGKLNGVPAGKKAFFSVGPSLNISYNKSFGKKKQFNYRTDFKSYTSYADPWKQPDISWDNTLDIKVSRFITTTVKVGTVYKNNTGKYPQLQFQYSFTLGLAYTFKNK